MAGDLRKSPKSAGYRFHGCFRIASERCGGDFKTPEKHPAVGIFSDPCQRFV